MLENAKTHLSFHPHSKNSLKKISKRVTREETLDNGERKIEL
jgi:hypothetical protein